jgi:Lysyl oxidase
MKKHVWPLLAAAMLSCAPETIEGKTDPGALIKTNLNGTVGVLLDEIPAGQRDRVAASLIAKPSSFWIARARQQIKLTTYRLVFRQYFYGGGMGKRQQLPLPPPAVQRVVLTNTARRAAVGTHDYVLVDYAMDSHLLTTFTSPKDSDTKLGAVGGIVEEPFTLPVDPELLFQRTGYACVDEEDFPPNSVDSEEMDSFYDHECGVESSLSAVGQCHLTALPTKSCKQALTDSVGSFDTIARFERVKWDANVANQVRVASFTNDDGPDLALLEDEFHENRVVYKYIPSNSCTVVEQCVGGSGWRRLLQFSTSDKNVGKKTLEVGMVDYYLSGKNGYVSDWGLFEFSACHQHYHFQHYGDFHYGPEVERKNGFCLQSTARVQNHESGPLTNPYGGCDRQGVEASWADQYKAGLECQWVDVTGVDTSTRAKTYPLSFTSNPDGFLCEGNPVLDDQGLPIWEPTEFRTATGGVVHKQKCDFFPNWKDNNGHSYNVTLGLTGESFINLPCERGQEGPLRNCGFEPPSATLDCTPGATTTVSCTLPNNSKPQVARLCDYSFALNAGTACRWEDAVANAVVETTQTFTFKCPAARDANEPGGRVSLYSAPVFSGDADARVTCTVQ